MFQDAFTCQVYAGIDPLTEARLLLEEGVLDYLQVRKFTCMMCEVAPTDLATTRAARPIDDILHVMG